MNATMFTYRVDEVPDATDPTLRVTAGGDLHAAVQAGGEHLSRTLASFPPRSVSVAIRFLFQPTPKRGDPQQRLVVEVAAQAHHEDVAASLSLLLEQGPLDWFYKLKAAKPVCIPWERFHAACDVLRHRILLEPTVAGEFNARIPPEYWFIRSFETRDDNDLHL